MIAEIIKILSPTQSRNGNAYIRVEFKDELGNWLKTDLCYDYRNWSRWKKLLKVGNRLFNLRQKDSQTIDADSYPHLLEGRKINKIIMPKTDEEWCKAGYI
jgi:hypothetical protein